MCVLNHIQTGFISVGEAILTSSVVLHRDPHGVQSPSSGILSLSVSTFAKWTTSRAVTQKKR